MVLYTGKINFQLERDIKGSNIMLTKDGTAVLGDFGVAIQEDDESTKGDSTTQIVGTPYWGKSNIS